MGGDRISVVQSWPKPLLMELRTFKGLLQYFRRFIKKFSEITASLTGLTRKEKGIRLCDGKCDGAFQLLKNALRSPPVLVLSDWLKPFYCHVHACQIAVGGCLTQKSENGKDRASAYFLKRLSSAEENYIANDGGLLGLVYFLKRFHCYLEGFSFEVITDNQVLKHFFLNLF